MEQINAIIQAPARQYNLRDKTKIEYNESQNTHACPQCDAVFGAVAQLEKHRVTHVEKKAYECAICKKCFPEKSILDSHMLQHNDTKRPHACNLCEASFALAAQLKIHRTTHRSQGAHKCNICNKSFSIKNYLKTHMLLHKDRKVYNCDPCGASFYTQERLALHLNKHNIRCDLCRKIFAKQEQLDMHVSRQHVTCQVCQKRFIDKLQLDLHMLKHSCASNTPTKMVTKSIDYEDSLTKFVTVAKPSTVSYAGQNTATRQCSKNEKLSNKNRVVRKNTVSLKKKNENSSPIFIVSNNSVIKLLPDQIPDVAEGINPAIESSNTDYTHMVTMTRANEDCKASTETYQEMKNVYGQQYGLAYDMHLDQFNYLYSPPQTSHDNNSNSAVQMKIHENLVTNNVTYYRAPAPESNTAVSTNSRLQSGEEVVEVSDESTDPLDTMAIGTAAANVGPHFSTENIVVTAQQNFSWKYVDQIPFSHHSLLRERLTELQEANNADEVPTGLPAVVGLAELHCSNGIIQGDTADFHSSNGINHGDTATFIKTEKDLSDNQEFLSDDDSQKAPFSIS